MLISELREKWCLLPNSISDLGFYSIRITKDCLPELFIGKDSSNNRCLILSISNDINVDYQNCYKEKLSIEYLPCDDLITLQLNDTNFIDLFDDLILSIYNYIKEAVDVTFYPKVMFRTFHKWSNFFEDEKNKLHSAETIKGLWGELVILKNELKEASSTMLYNDILKSWRGPYDEGHDFVRDLIDFEVKTKEVNNQRIHVSSEYQLAEENGKGLELVILSVESDVVNGISISHLVNEIRDLLYSGLSDFTILLSALSQKNITMQNICLYDSYKYVPIKSTSYNCCEKKFPRIIKKNLDVAQANVSYSLLVNELEDFIVDTRMYN